MDIFDLIITIAILAGGAFLSGGKKKTSGKKAGPVASPASGGRPVMHQQPVHGNYGGVASGNGSTSQKSKRKPAQQPSYFTYENADVQWNANPNVEEVSHQQSVDVDEPSTLVSDFDLRQAVIYQTILQNNYISEMK